MKRAAIVGISVVVIVLVTISFSRTDNDDSEIFHVTLADPTLYDDGVYYDEFMISSGNYAFDFVPNGDSPKILSIQLLGESFEFSEDFVLNGTRHNAGSSEYYTWDYIGKKNFEILNDQDLEIKIDPNSETKGPVSVDIKSIE